MEDRGLHVVFGAGQVGAAIARELYARGEPPRPSRSSRWGRGGEG